MNRPVVLIHFPQRSSGSGSMSYYCDLLVEGLGKRGYQVRVVSKRDLIRAARRGPWRILLTKTPAVLSTWPELLRQLLADPKIWLVNISQEYIPPFAASKSINIIHDLIQIDYPRSRPVGLFYRYLLPFLARKAALNISVSHATALRLAALRVPALVVYNEFELPEGPQLSGERQPARRFTACWVGTLAKHKNITDYLAAGSAMPDRSFAAVLPERDARRVAMEFEVPGNMHIFHSLQAKDYDQLLRSSRFLVSTSLAEGFGRPPADGALAGCDIVLTDIPIYRELYHGLAHFYPPGDPASLIGALAQAPLDIYSAAIERFTGWARRHHLVDVIDQTISAADSKC